MLNSKTHLYFTRQLEEIMNLVASGEVTPVIDKVFSMENIADAHKHIEDGNQFGKVVLVP
mgnify:CR=1 FL=1